MVLKIELFTLLQEQRENQRPCGWVASVFTIKWSEYHTARLSAYHCINITTHATSSTFNSNSVCIVINSYIFSCFFDVFTFEVHT